MTTTNQTVHDPVCHMDIGIEEAAGSSDHDGLTYYFCSMGCKADFDANPEGVLEAESTYDHSQPVDMMMGDATPAGAAPMATGTSPESSHAPSSPPAAPPPPPPPAASPAASTSTSATTPSMSMSGQPAGAEKKPWWKFW